MDNHVYIAGPMSGLPDHNYPEFNRMATVLEKMGYEVLNPATIANGDTSKPYNFYIRESLKMISNASMVVFLNGWEKSKGANLEKHCADCMGIPCYDQSFNLIYDDQSFNLIDDKTMSICQEADNLVSVDRQNQYGHPFDNFSDISVGWNVIAETQNITAEKVGLMFIWAKICREKFKPKYDNILDIIGYAKTVDLCKKFKKEKKES